MRRMLALELKKIKGTFLYILLPIAFLAPVALVLIQFAPGHSPTISEIVTKNSAFIQLISFACVVVCGCYIITREYKSNMTQYLAVTPNSMVRILFSKFMLLFLMTLILQLSVFAALFAANSVLCGFDGNLGLRYLTAGILSTLFLSCLIPAIGFVGLWRRNFAGASIIFLVLVMLTYPFAFMNWGYILPHLVPLILVSEFLGSNRYVQGSYLYGSLMLAATCAIFTYLSVRLVKKAV